MIKLSKFSRGTLIRIDDIAEYELAINEKM